MRLATASDEAGSDLRDVVCRAARDLGHEVEDHGEFEDFPDAALSACDAVRSGRADRAVLVCSTGVGVAIAANKVPGIRAALSHDTYTARLAVEHDDVTVLCLGSAVIARGAAAEVLEAFLSATYWATEKFDRRLAKVARIEDEPRA